MNAATPLGALCNFPCAGQLRGIDEAARFLACHVRGEHCDTAGTSFCQHTNADKCAYNHWPQNATAATTNGGVHLGSASAKAVHGKRVERDSSNASTSVPASTVFASDAASTPTPALAPSSNTDSAAATTTKQPASSNSTIATGTTTTSNVV